MTDLDIDIVTPFGPSILISKCPDYIVDSLNQYVDDVENDENLKLVTSSEYENVPNLLGRDFTNIYLTEEKCKEIKIKQFVEFLGNYYTESNCETLGKNNNLRLGIIHRDNDFKLVDKYVYADCWINRYYMGDYTPLHSHGPILSGIIFLKVPEVIEKLNTIKNNDQEDKLHGRLQFVYGNKLPFSSDLWTPSQEKGIVMLFPHWLRHLVYPQKTNEERRTLSFNLIFESEYCNRKRQITTNYYEFS